MKIISKMKKLTFILILAMCSLLFSCETSSDSKNQDSALQEKVERSVLLKNLDQFNANLSQQCDGFRLFDLKTNSVIAKPLTRGFNWRSCGWADASGAYAGGRAGAIYGSALSPSGSIAGAVVGAILCAAVCSGIEAWIQHGAYTLTDPSNKYTAFGDLIVSDKAFDAEEIYGIYCEMPGTEFVKIKNELSLNFDIDPTLQIAGIAHNVLLDGMMTNKENSLECAEEGLYTPNLESESLIIDNDIISKESEMETFRNEFSSQLVKDSTFKMEFSKLINDQLRKSQEGSSLEEANSMPEYVMNLFLEAYSSYTTDSNDITSVINYYHSQLEASSELTQEEKTSLYIGMVVAGYSAKYWEQCTY